MKLGSSLWLVWVVSALAGSGVLLGAMFYGGQSRALLLIGETTSGHHQIELACEACHTSAFGGKEVIQDACVGCHAEELERAKDSHPAKKFTDPRNADRIAILDATQCITCHTEHRPEITNAMGVTLPDDYCALCHEDVGKNRPSHIDLPFETCATAGCHNYHDNRALYEDFLERHANKPEIALKAYLELRANPPEKPAPEEEPITLASKADAPSQHMKDSKITEDWLATAHSAAGVNCSGCHAPDAKSAEEIEKTWIEAPDHKTCANCHTHEVKSFTQGKHGMRLAEGMTTQLDGPLGFFKNTNLGPMSPKLARIPMSSKAHDTELNCTTCHSAHAFNTEKAEIDACLTCHNDEHSKSYIDSPHHKLWLAEKNGSGDKGTGVTCATCHMPRFLHEDPDTYEETLVVNHNQNDNLRPNEKMIRSVCMSCHGLGFAIDALADPKSIKSNFAGRPSVHVESIDWVIKRLKEREGKKSK